MGQWALQVRMIGRLAVILACQLLGEGLTRVLGRPVPGMVPGMAAHGGAGRCVLVRVGVVWDFGASKGVVVAIGPQSITDGMGGDRALMAVPVIVTGITGALIVMLPMNALGMGISGRGDLRWGWRRAGSGRRGPFGWTL
jgi:hypothetical protein